MTVLTARQIERLAELATSDSVLSTLEDLAEELYGDLIHAVVDPAEATYSKEQHALGEIVAFDEFEPFDCANGHYHAMQQRAYFLCGLLLGDFKGTLLQIAKSERDD